MKDTLLEYIRRDGQLAGAVVAKKLEDGNVRIGYSLCNPKDQFDKKLAVKIAEARATCGVDYQLPREDRHYDTVIDRVEVMMSRASNYFKVPTTKVLVSRTPSTK